MRKKEATFQRLERQIHGEDGTCTKTPALPDECQYLGPKLALL